MLVKLLDKLNGYACMSGNYCNPDLSGVCRTISEITREGWRMTNNEKALCAERINDIDMPDWVKVVVYKRSFPFEAVDYIPKFVDIGAIGRLPRCVVMHRSLSECAHSVVRRGIAENHVDACRRVEMAHSAMESQLKSDGHPPVLRIEYSRLTSKGSKLMELNRLEPFLDIPVGSLTIHASFIRQPTNTQVGRGISQQGNGE